MVNEIWQGDVLELAKKLPDNSIHCIVTSPPYWSLRDYGIAGQLGLEPTPEEYMEKMVLIFRELRRALREDGTLWLNLGDSYASHGAGSDGKELKWLGEAAKNRKKLLPPPGLKPKDLCGIPWRVALALQNDGWYLRSDIIWSKPNPMPESVTDRPTKAHEYVFLLTKSGKYFYDAEAIREPNITESNYRNKANEFQGSKAYLSPLGQGNREWNNPNGRNRRTVWEIATQPYPEAHFATYPEALVEPCILAGTSAKGVCPECGSSWQRVTKPTEEYAKHLGKDWADDEKDQIEGRGHFLMPDGQRSNQRRIKRNAPSITASYETTGWQPTCTHNTEPIPAIVLDPFAGSGTTLSVAKRLGRSFLGFELNPDYIKLAWTRIDQTQPPLIIENDIPVVAQYAPKQLSF